eukprot:CAMPEP_0203874802 /NCGR_PEP_ID=MMETSP0359-20131031/20477_1 /ASSEMBLY_ACC=CAM_ASM_000338 /TAXON_ID=268821 /ORGANISM="Scrippsiella Hangoei, Strain SHTV-5" /LENGTH=61 /DNA_ID=CAMNT_0050793581 /DNA_START=202 /DNA_END=383 /DNA_ORIENTATION=-
MTTGRCIGKQKSALTTKSSAGTMCSEDLQACLVLVGGGDDKGRLALGVGLVHTGASLQQVL